MKKLLALLLAVVMVLSMTACAPQKIRDKVLGEENKEGDKPGTAHIDDCYIEITECVAPLTSKFYGESSLILVKVDFTNNSDDSTSMFFTAKIKAFQNGTELTTVSTTTVEDAIQVEDYTTDVLPGYTISTGYAFILKSTTDPVLVQICDDDDVITSMEYDF